jgi:outer membrane protein assembly factor BamB
MPTGIVSASLLGIALTAVVACAQVKVDDEPAPTDYRTWTDISGKFTLEAAMIKFADGKVHLQKKDGDVARISIGKLSKEDQRFVRGELANRKDAPRPGRGGGAADANSGNANWPGWLGPNRDGKSPDTGLLKTWPEGGPPLLWKASGIGRGYSSVAVVDGCVYITGVVGSNEVLSAFDMDGQSKWTVEHGPAHDRDYPGSRSTPTIDDGNLYFLSGKGKLGCYDALNGQAKWARELSEFGGQVPGWAYAESVLIHKELAIVTPGGDKCIVALDKKNGRPMWSSSGFSAGAQYGSCISVDYRGAEMIIAGTAEGIVAVDANSGGMLWANPFSARNTANCPTPAFADGYVFWANGYDKGGICLQLDVRGKNVAATEAWTTRDMVCHHGGYIIHEGYIYGNHAESWVCLDLRTGQQKWRERAVGKGSLCYADGMLYLFSENGGQAALATCSPEGLEIRGEVTVEGQEMSWAHPVVIGGRLYLRYDDNLYCFNVRE